MRCGPCRMPPGIHGASRCVQRLPGGPLRPMRWVMIIEIWYWPRSLVLVAHHEDRTGGVPHSRFGDTAEEEAPNSSSTMAADNEEVVVTSSEMLLYSFCGCAVKMMKRNGEVSVVVLLRDGLALFRNVVGDLL